MSENTQVATKSNNKVTDFSLGIFGTSDNFIMAGQMAKALSQSTIVPKDYQGNEANAMVAIEIATRLHTSPIMVMQNLHVIQGRPSWSAQYLIAMVNGSGKYDIELQFDEKFDKATIRTVLEKFVASYDPSDDSAVWFDKVKALTEEIGFTSDMKAYKADPTAFPGTVADVSTFIRQAVTGKPNSPDLYTVMQILGKDRSVARIQAVVDTL